MRPARLSGVQAGDGGEPATGGAARSLKYGVPVRCRQGSRRRSPGPRLPRRAGGQLASQRSNVHRPVPSGRTMPSASAPKQARAASAVVADLVAVGGDGRPEAGERGPLGLQRRHGVERGVGHPSDRAPPAGVDGGHDVGRRLVEHDRHAVAHHDASPTPGVAVAAARRPQGVADGQRPPAAVAVGHDRMRPWTWWANTMSAGRRPRRSGPAPVLDGAGRVVADAKAQVEVGVRPPTRRRGGPSQHVERVVEKTDQRWATTVSTGGKLAATAARAWA